MNMLRTLALLLACLPVLAQDIPGYERRAFTHWTDADRDGQNARAEVLIAWSQAPVTFTDARERTVSGGRWTGPYTGETFTQASQLDIDHVVPLAYAWAHGAHAWTADKRRAFANDPLNLLPVQASANRQKGAQGPLDWMPPREAFACEYLLRWRRVIDAYRLAPDARVMSMEVRICDMTL
ncbi:MAG: HNH endonuclease family protein [Rhodospirillaceae bacterium]|nr:HNH endonuclease family protein [Rhodospirillaceae bacterium]